MTTTTSGDTPLRAHARATAQQYSEPEIREYVPPVADTRAQEPETGSVVQFDAAVTRTVTLTYDADREEERAQLRAINSRR